MTHIPSRLAGIVVTFESLALLATTGEKNIHVEFDTDRFPELPKTSRFLGVSMDQMRRAFVLVFEDDSFDLVPETSLIPYLGIFTVTVLD